MPAPSFRVFCTLAAALLGSACDDGVLPSSPPRISVTPEIRSIQVGQTQQFTATWRDPSDASRRPTSIVWSTVDATIATVAGDGLVTGVRPGRTGVVARADALTDTSYVQVERTPGRMTIEPPTLVAPGDVIRLSAIVEDTDGKLMSGVPIVWSVSDSQVATVSDYGWLTAIAEGTVVVTGVAAPISSTREIEIRVPPPATGCETGGLTLRVGEVRTFAGAEATSLCLAGEAEYVLVTANAGSEGLETSVLGDGIAVPVGPPRPTLLSTRRVDDASIGSPMEWRFERDLRRRERALFDPRAARPGPLTRSARAATPLAVGDLLPLNASTECSTPDIRTGRIQFIGQRSIVVADTSNPAGVSPADYASFGMAYDTLLHPVVTEHFGEPAGMNGESRVVIFYTRAVNELTPENPDGVVGGFFWAGDLFPRTSCAESNEREMFYMLAADPEGSVNGNAHSVDYVRRVTASTIAHELQHLINASRRIYINDAPVWEESWLDEGLSHIAEEVVFYHAIGYTAGRNLGPADIASTQSQLDATSRYAISNLLRLDRYLSDPEAQGPFQEDDDLATRGAIWQYLRYSLDRRGGDARVHLSKLVDSQTAGLPNLEGVFGADPRKWFVDNVTALYADDAIEGIAPEHQHPSWNFRPIYEWLLDGYGLERRVLSEGISQPMTLQPWGTAYVRTAVGASRVARIGMGTDVAPPPAALRVVLMRTK